MTMIAPGITKRVRAMTEWKFKAATELTIATGAVTATQSQHTIDTESDASSDDLDTINGIAENELVMVRPANDARTVVLKHGTGNLECPGDSDVTLDDAHDVVFLLGLSSTVSVMPFGGSGIASLLADTTPQLGGALDGQGNDLNNLGVVFMKEQAAADADVSGSGQIWVKTATPNQLWFTNDAGTDIQLGAGGGSTEGTAILSTGETGGTKFLREDGDGTCSWQAGAGGGSGDFLADGSVAMTGDINADGNNIDNGGVVFLKEQAAADADVAGSGQIWVKTATPNQLWFTNDAGTDTQLGTSASSSSAWYDNTDGATITIDGANGKRQMVTLGGNRNIEWTGLTEGDAILLRVIQDGTGSRLVSSWGSNATINWPGATNPTLTTTASQIDILGFLVIDATTDAEVIEAVTVAQNIAP